MMNNNALIPANSLNLYMAQIQRFELLSREEEEDLARRFHEEGDVAAAHRLVCANLRFVVKIAQEYRSYGFRTLDLIQEGNMGLMQAVKKFDPDKGYRLISYAVWWIRAYIQNYILKMWSMVKMGTTQNQRKLFYNLRKLSGKQRALNGKVDHDQLSETLDIDKSEILEMEVRMAGRDFSLDAHIESDGGSVTYLDMLPDQAESQEVELMQQETSVKQKEVVSRIFNIMNERERFIAKKRLMAENPMTLQEIGDRYKITRERARQIEEGLKKKIRKALKESESEIKKLLPSPIEAA